MNILLTVLSFILVFVIVVVVHEYGHFWVARRMGVRVLRFSIGFGPIFWRKRDRHGTEFALAAIPLGGYVKMLDGREKILTEEEKPFAFDHKPVIKRIAIVVAGPLFNFLFAILVYAGILMMGITNIVPFIAHVQADSPAAKVGIHAGDRFVTIDGKHTDDRQSVYLALLQRTGESGSLEVTVREFPDKALRHYELPIPSAKNPDQKQIDPLANWGITLGLPLPAVLGQVMPDSAAMKGGLKAGDKVLALDGLPIKDWYDLVEYVRKSPDKPIEFTIEREGQKLIKKVTPQTQEIEGEKIGMLGVQIAVLEWPAELKSLQQENIFNALKLSIAHIWDLSVLTLDMMSKMLRGLVGLENLAGPITIAQGAQVSVANGWISFMGFLVLLSVNLGVINLLPIPMLDGGHLLYYVIEGIVGKPVSERVQRVGLVIGFIIVLSLMLVGIHNDITRFK